MYLYETTRMLGPPDEVGPLTEPQPTRIAGRVRTPNPAAWPRSFPTVSVTLSRLENGLVGYR